jgi:hypothetical protein
LAGVNWWSNILTKYGKYGIINNALAEKINQKEIFYAQ